MTRKPNTRSQSKQKGTQPELMSPIKSYNVKGHNIEIPVGPDIFTIIDSRQKSISSLTKYLEQLIIQLESSPEALELLGCSIENLKSAMNTWNTSDYKNIQRLHGRLPEEGTTLEHFYVPYLQWMDDHNIPYQLPEALGRTMSDKEHRSKVVEQLKGSLEIAQKIHYYDNKKRVPLIYSLRTFRYT